MNKIKRIIFVDSTIGHDELAQYIYEDDLLLPGIRRGDLIQCLIKYPFIESIIIVDGVFEQQASITHKEILWVLEKGVKVTGLSSMGALRAYELHDYGMLGYGEIFQNYIAGLLDGDDEVATSYFLSNDSSEKTIAMVNIRATLDKLHLHNEDLIFKIRNIHYKHRNWLTIKAVVPDEVYVFLKLNYVDQKKRDVVSYFQSTQLSRGSTVTVNYLKNTYIINDLINQMYAGVIDFIEDNLKKMSCSSIHSTNPILENLADEIVNYLEYQADYTHKIASILFELSSFSYGHARLKNFSDKIRREQKLFSSLEFIKYLDEKKISTHNLTSLFEGILKLENYLFINWTLNKKHEKRLPQLVKLKI
jgi:hypothetical protein